MLAEGNSIRSIERMTGVHRDTIVRLGVRAGEACLKIVAEKMVASNCQQNEVDEVWGFIEAKQKNADRAEASGDLWTFFAVDSETKIIPKNARRRKCRTKRAWSSPPSAALRHDPTRN